MHVREARKLMPGDLVRWRNHDGKRYLATLTEVSVYQDGRVHIETKQGAILDLHARDLERDGEK